MIAGLLWSPIAFSLLISFIIAVMMKEYLKITISKAHPLGQFLSILTGIGLFILTFITKGYGISPNYFMLLVIPIAAMFISFLYEKDKESYKNHPYLFTPILYIALPFALTSYIAFDASGEFNGFLILSLFIILWASDVGAYIFGMTLGQKNGHRLFPSISPKKSWEGYFGSLFTSILTSFILVLMGWLPFSIPHSIVIGILINIFGTLGDLVESQIKRHYNVKDSGTIMPGHGGLLDRFDGAIVGFPITIAYIYIFGLI